MSGNCKHNENKVEITVKPEQKRQLSYYYY